MSDDTVRIRVDNSRVEAAWRLCEQFVAEGGCAALWLDDPSRCVAAAC